MYLAVSNSGVSDVRQNTEDMLRNLKIALYAERSVRENRKLHVNWGMERCVVIELNVLQLQ